MKVLSYICCLVILVACKGKPKSAVADTFTPYQLNKDYKVIDTGFFYAPETERTYAVVQGKNMLTDTIDKYVGMQQMGNNSYLYLTIINTRPLKKNLLPKTGYKNTISAGLGSYTVITGDKKQRLNQLAAGFNDFFSSPRVINHHVCFWQLKKSANGNTVNYAAAVYDPETHTTINYPIEKKDIETDESGYLPPPYLKNDTIYFDLGEHLMELTKDFKKYN